MNKVSDTDWKQLVSMEDKDIDMSDIEKLYGRSITAS